MLGKFIDFDGFDFGICDGLGNTIGLRVDGFGNGIDLDGFVFGIELVLNGDDDDVLEYDGKPFWFGCLWIL